MSKVLPNTDDKTAIRISADGKELDYPSTRAQGWDSITYQQLSPKIHGQASELRPVTIKVKDLPGALARDLAEAHRSGNLRVELGRHLTFLETSGAVDERTTKLLRTHQKELTGHHTRDGEVLGRVTQVLNSLAPEKGQP